MKKFFFALIAVLAAMPAMLACAAVSVTLNGQAIGLPKEPIVLDGRVYVPALATVKALGADISSYDELMAIVSKNDIKVYFSSNYINRFTASDADELWEKIQTNRNEGYVETDTGIIYDRGRPFLPVRPLCELMGLTVDWDGETSTVDITAPAEFLSEVNKDASFYWRSTDELKAVTLTVEYSAVPEDMNLFSLEILYTIQNCQPMCGLTIGYDGFQNNENSLIYTFLCEPGFDTDTLVEVLKASDYLSGGGFRVSCTEAPYEW